MTHWRASRWFSSLLMLGSVAILSACASAESGGTPASIVAATPAISTAVVTPAGNAALATPANSTTVVTPASSTPLATPAGSTPVVTPASSMPLATPAAAGTTVALDFGSGSFVFPESAAGLAELASYQATLKLSFDGTQDGKSQQWSKTYVMLAAGKPAARQLTIAKTGDLADLAPVFRAEMNGTAYMRSGPDRCTATPITAGDSLAERLEPAGMLGGVIGAELAGSEPANGIAANHYTFDERASGAKNIAKSTGELWVASAGGYIVKYLLTTKGGAAYFGKGIDGTLRWDYELTGVNQPVAIALPKECLAGLVDAPRLSDATDLQQAPGLLGFSTHASLADVVAFYQKQLPPLGWKPVDEPAIAGTFALLNYTQGTQTLKVIVTAGKDATSLRVVVKVGQP